MAVSFKGLNQKNLCKVQKRKNGAQLPAPTSSPLTLIPSVCTPLPSWWSWVYLCKQAAAVCDILLLQPLSFAASDSGCLSLRGQLHSDLPVSLNKSWRSIFALHFLEVLRVKSISKKKNHAIIEFFFVVFQVSRFHIKCHFIKSRCNFKLILWVDTVTAHNDGS